MVKPNDGMCHMMDDDVTSNEDGTIDYTSWAKLVYKITHSTLDYTHVSILPYGIYMCNGSPYSDSFV